MTVLGNPPALAQGRTLDQLIAQALQESPDLRAVEHERDAARQRIPQAGTWMDPMVSLGYRNMPVTSPWPGVDPMSNIELMASQRLPAPGKTSAREDVARSNVDTLDRMLDEKRVELVLRLRTRHAQLALVRQLREVTRRHVALVEQLVAVVSAKLEAGSIGQQALLRVMVLRDRLQDSLADFDRREHELVAELNALAHLPVDDPIVTPTLQVEEISTAPAQLEHESAEGSPTLKRLDAAAHTQDLMAQQAEVEQRPDVELSLAYMIRLPSQNSSGMNMVSAGIAMPLPWFFNASRWGAMADENRAMARATRSQRDATWDRLRSDLAAADARLRRATDKSRTYQDSLVPSATRTLESTLSAYQVERADFADLIEAELELLELERGLYEARADAAMAHAELDALRGRLATAATTPVENSP
ncbi:MAG: TolC family protein [Pseudomonadota bacterium]